MAPTAAPGNGCAWWNLICQGTHQVADVGMGAITHSIAAGAAELLNEITKIIDHSTEVPLEDPTYQRIYTGFLGLAGVVVAVILGIALVVAALRRDAATLGHAVSGLFVAGIGGALYIVMAQLLVGLDDWLSNGVVAVTRHNLVDGLTSLSAGFGQIGNMPSVIAGNMLLVVLMMVMLLASLVLWFVLVLRQLAILLVVAFAPLLIAGYLWEPTRGWVRRATEVLIALIFTKTTIYAIFGIGLALLVRDQGQTLSGFVGSLVLVTAASFSPLLMLRLVHFVAETHLAGNALGTLHAGGVAPLLSHLPHPGMDRHDMARQPPPPDPGWAAPAPGPQVAEWGGASAGATQVGAGSAAAGGVTAGVVAAAAAAQHVKHTTESTVTNLSDSTRPAHRGDPHAPGPDGPTLPGPDIHGGDR